MQNARLDEVHTRIKIFGRNINNLRYADDTTLMAEDEELKSLSKKVKEESQKVGLKLNIQKTKIMASWLMLKLKLQYFVMWCKELTHWKRPDVGKDWWWEEKGMTEDEMVGWHHWLDGHEFEWTPGVGDGQEGLVCCDSWGRKESGMTEQLNWTVQKQFTMLSKMQLSFNRERISCKKSLQCFYSSRRNDNIETNNITQDKFSLPER